ncbi:MAG TPA: DedA family protein [Longimicrobiales bacterium]|nr:DedA family protein [Longimicrobiales bacterium]
MGPVSRALDLLGALPVELLYLILGGGAFLENLVPPVPADTFVVVGGLLADRGSVDPWIAFALILVLNAAGALAVWWAGYHYGAAFFRGSVGRRLLRPRQLGRIQGFYHRHGVWAIFGARFLPGLRAVVPAFAGVSHLGFWRVAPPVVVASTLWYGSLFMAGRLAGRNLARLEGALAGVNGVLVGLAVVLGGGAVYWWIRTHREGADPEEDARGE